MKSKLTQGRTLGLIGMSDKGLIVKIKDTICWRKPADIVFTKRTMSKYKHAIGMVSRYNIYRKPNTPFCKAWCHCFKDPKKYFPNKPLLLLSESDFVDPSFIKFSNLALKWDFYYFTVGGELGNKYKGMKLFVDSLPILCGKMGLKGVLIKYAKAKKKFVLNSSRKRIWKKYKKNIKVLLGKKDVSNIISRSRFGFFPNITDCSPLLLSESLVMNTPILVNEDILGGWKYINENTGFSFRLDTLEEGVNFVLNNKLDAKKSYMENHGYKNSAIKLAEFCKIHIPSFKKFSMVGFVGTESIMKKVCR